MGEVHANIENKRGRMKMQKLCISYCQFAIQTVIIIIVCIA